MSGGTTFVGAPQEDSNASKDNDATPGAGAAYSYEVTPDIVVPSVVPSPAIPPTLRVRGRKTIETLRKRVVIRGQVGNASEIRQIDVKARGAKVAKAKVKGNDTFKVVLRVKNTQGRVVVKLRAIGKSGVSSKREKVRILRR